MSLVINQVYAFFHFSDNPIQSIRHGGVASMDELFTSLNEVLRMGTSYQPCTNWEVKICTEKFSFTFHSCFHTFIHVGFINILKKNVGIVDSFVKSLPCTPIHVGFPDYGRYHRLDLPIVRFGAGSNSGRLRWISCMSNCFRIPSRRPKYNRLRPKQPCIHFH